LYSCRVDWYRATTPNLEMRERTNDSVPNPTLIEDIKMKICTL